MPPPCKCQKTNGARQVSMDVAFVFGAAVSLVDVSIAVFCHVVEPEDESEALQCLMLCLPPQSPVRRVHYPTCSLPCLLPFLYLSCRSWIRALGAYRMTADSGW